MIFINNSCIALIAALPVVQCVVFYVLILIYCIFCCHSVLLKDDYTVQLSLQLLKQ